MVNVPFKHYLPRSLFGRSLLILVVPILLIQVTTAYVFLDRHWEKMTSRLAFSVAGEVALIADLIEHGGDANDPAGLFGHFNRYLNIYFSFEEAGKIRQAKSQNPWESLLLQRLQQEMRGSLNRPFVISSDLEEKWVSVQVQLANGVLTATFPERRIFSSSSYIFLLWMVGISAVLLLIAVIFMRNQIKPIRRLALAAERFGKGREVVFFKPEGAQEVRQAAKAFLEMRERIDRQIQQRTSMLAGVSHDLRTPLTRMKLQVELLGDSPDVKALKDDIRQMERLVDAYLSFARGDGEEKPQRTDLEQLLHKTVEAVRGAEALTVELKLQGDLSSVVLRPLAFERCLNNLLSNAAKFADEIHVDAKRADGYIEILIDDNGPGIPSSQYEEVFKPFYRVDHSRNVKTGGVGLGLPIAAGIIHMHGGEIELGQSPQGGLRVTLVFPV